MLRGCLREGGSSPLWVCSGLESMPERAERGRGSGASKSLEQELGKQSREGVGH